MNYVVLIGVGISFIAELIVRTKHLKNLICFWESFFKTDCPKSTVIRRGALRFLYNLWYYWRSFLFYCILFGDLRVVLLMCHHLLHFINEPDLKHSFTFALGREPFMEVECSLALIDKCFFTVIVNVKWLLFYRFVGYCLQLIKLLSIFAHKVLCEFRIKFLLPLWICIEEIFKEFRKLFPLFVFIDWFASFL